MAVDRPSAHYSDSEATSAPGAPLFRNRLGHRTGQVLTAAAVALAVALPFMLSQGDSTQPLLDPVRLQVTELYSAKELGKGAAELDADLAHSQAFGSEMVGCLNDLGFTKVADMGNGGYETTPAPPGREQAFGLAERKCRLLLGYPDDPELGSDVFNAVMYLRLLDTYQCLVDAGFSPGRPPDVEAFIESEGAMWHPYVALLADPRDMAVAIAQCPAPGH